MELLIDRFVGPFDKDLKAIKDGGYDRVATIKDFMKIRVDLGESHAVSLSGSRTSEGVIYAPSGEPRIIRESPLITSPELARKVTELARDGKGLFLDPHDYEKKLDNSHSWPGQSTSFDTSRLGEYSLFTWLAEGEELAYNYGEFLRNSKHKIKQLPLWAVDSDYVKRQKSPIIRQVWFGNLPDDHS